MIAWGSRHPALEPPLQPEERVPRGVQAARAGLVLELATIERCFELGIEAHELLGADDEYKLRFSTSQRRHRYFRAFPRGLGPAMRYAWRRFVPTGARARLQRP